MGATGQNRKMLQVQLAPKRSAVQTSANRFHLVYKVLCWFLRKVFRAALPYAKSKNEDFLLHGAPRPASDCICARAQREDRGDEPTGGPIEAIRMNYDDLVRLTATLRRVSIYLSMDACMYALYTAASTERSACLALQRDLALFVCADLWWWYDRVTWS